MIMKDSIITGVLFDFMGWLTCRDEKLTLSSTDEAGPAVAVIEEFCKMRGLSLDESDVLTWQNKLDDYILKSEVKK